MRDNPADDALQRRVIRWPNRSHWSADNGTVSSWLIAAAALALASFAAAGALSTLVSTLADDVVLAANGEASPRNAPEGANAGNADGTIPEAAAATGGQDAALTGDQNDTGTTGGGGGTGDGSLANGVQTRSLVGQEFTPVPDGTYSDERPGFHEYSVEPNLICSASQGCTEAEMIEYLSQFAYPGQDPNNPVENGEINPVEDTREWYSRFQPGGDVQTFVSPDGLTVVNQTQEGHVFHDGIIVRTLTQVDGDWFITTSGIGNNEAYSILGLEVWDADEMATMNEEEGTLLFNHVDEGMAEFIRNDRADPIPVNPGPGQMGRPGNNSDDPPSIVVVATPPDPIGEPDDDDEPPPPPPPQPVGEPDDDDEPPPPPPEDDDDDPPPPPDPDPEPVGNPDDDEEPAPDPEPAGNPDDDEEPAPDPEPAGDPDDDEEPAPDPVTPNIVYS